MNNKYAKDISHIETLDAYRLQELYQMHPCAEHVVKKLLAPGQRSGGKSLDQDIADCIQTLQRWQTMRAEDVKYAEKVSAEPWPEVPPPLPGTAPLPPTTAGPQPVCPFCGLLEIFHDEMNCPRLQSTPRPLPSLPEPHVPACAVTDCTGARTLGKFCDSHQFPDSRSAATVRKE